MGITVDSSALQKLFKKLGDELDRKQGGLVRGIQAALEDTIDSIDERVTERGKDVKERKMRGYTKGYKQFKENYGSGNRQTRYVDMTLTGQMMSSLQSKVSPKGKGYEGTIGFNNVEAGKKAKGNQERRKFFGLSKSDEKQFRETLQDAMAKLLRKL